MHKVANIRDLNLRAGLPANQRWAAYVRDLDALFDLTFGSGGFANINSSESRLSHQNG